MNTMNNNGKITFICSCSGCRGIKKDYDRPYIEAIIDQLEGFYFSPNTRKFFRVRLNKAHTLASGGVLIISTMGAGPDISDGRDIDHAYFCQYGHLVDNAKYGTKIQARKGLFSLSDKVLSCTCHGCTIDRAGGVR